MKLYKLTPFLLDFKHEKDIQYYKKNTYINRLLKYNMMVF